MRAVYECLLDFVLHLVDDSESGNRENHGLLGIRDGGALSSLTNMRERLQVRGRVFGQPKTIDLSDCHLR